MSNLNIEEVTGKAEDLDLISYNRAGAIECATGIHFAAKLTALCQHFFDLGHKAGEHAVYDQLDAVEMWKLNGLPHCFFDEKGEAESMARFWWPNESPEQRYARVHYETIFKEKS